MISMQTTYKHKNLGEDVRFISGYYEYIEESKLNVHGRDVLYAVGIGILDNSCCGRSGCYFIEVPGYLVSWKTSQDEKGQVLSEVIRIEDENVKKEVTAALQKNYPMAQVNFL